MTSIMALEGVTSFLRLKDATNTCKRMRHSPTIGGNSSMQVGDWDCVAAVERLSALHYSVEFIFLSFGIISFNVEL